MKSYAKVIAHINAIHVVTVNSLPHIILKYESCFSTSVIWANTCRLYWSDNINFVGDITQQGYLKKKRRLMSDEHKVPSPLETATKLGEASVHMALNKIFNKAGRGHNSKMFRDVMANKQTQQASVPKGNLKKC